MRSYPPFAIWNHRYMAVAVEGEDMGNEENTNKKEAVVVAVVDIIYRGTLENIVGNMAIVDTMVPTAGPNPTNIKMMLHSKTNKE